MQIFIVNITRVVSLKTENEFTSVLLFISITFTLTCATSQKILSNDNILHK